MSTTTIHRCDLCGHVEETERMSSPDTWGSGEVKFDFRAQPTRRFDVCPKCMVHGQDYVHRSLVERFVRKFKR